MVEKIEQEDIENVYDISAMFDEEEKTHKITALGSVDIDKCISTNILSLDLILGGGLESGKWYEVCGVESSGKTTMAYAAVGSAITSIPNSLKGVIVDAEGVLDYTWFSNIIGIKDLDTVLGKRDENTGNWTIPPVVRHYKPDSGEVALKFVKNILKRMPDKVLIGKSWYYMFVAKQTKSGKKQYEDLAPAKLKSRLQGKYHKKLFAKTGNFFVPIPNNYAGPEFLIVIDSMPALIPESVSDDDSAAMGPYARLFSKYLNDIKSLMSKKGVITIGVNQGRERPLAFGDPFYTPCGNVLKHVVDVRLRKWAKSTPAKYGGKQIQIDGKDEYRWCKAKTIKNKLFIPHQEVEFRWWTGHKGKSGYGLDPVMDVYTYLEMTGQLEITSKGFKVNFPITKNTIFTMKTFKAFVLTKALKQKGKIVKYDLRKKCQRQIASGKSKELYLKAKEEASQE